MEHSLVSLCKRCEKLLETKDFSSLDTVLDEATLHRSAHPVLYFYKCIALEQLQADAAAILALAERGLMLKDDFTNLIAVQFNQQMKLGRYKDALANSIKLCELEPKNADHQFGCAEVLRKLGMPGSNQAAARGHLYVALSQLERGDVTQAKSELDKALGLDPQFSRARLLNVELAYYRGEFDIALAEARELFMDFIDDELDIDALEFSAKIWELRGNLAESVQFCYSILQRDPTHPYALRILAAKARNAGDSFTMLDRLDDITSHWPDDIWAHMTRMAYAGVYANDPDFLLATQQVSLLHRMVETFIEAGFYDAACIKLAQYPLDDVDRYRQLVEKSAWKLWRFYQYQSMRRILEDALQRIAPTAALYGLLAQAYSNTQTMQKGLEIIAQGQALDANDLMLGYCKATINADLWLHSKVYIFPDSLADELWRCLAAWLKHHPHDAFALYYIACVYYSKGDMPNARRFIQQAYDDGMNYSLSLYWYARILHGNGAYQEALDMFENKFEKRTISSLFKCNHYLTKADIISQLGDAERLEAVISLLRERWPQNIDAQYLEWEATWRQRCKPAVPK